MLLLTGYIDESGNDDIFTLSCLISDGGTWMYFEEEWMELLQHTNARLASGGLRTLSRYHAADCSSLKNEFAGWTKTEQIDFTKNILRIFQRHQIHIIAYSMNLRDLIEKIPETKPNPKGFAYVELMYFLMLEIGDFTLRGHPDALITIMHDHCEYDAALLEAFNQMLDDPNFEYAKRFTTLTPMRWEHCVLLQPADLIAYENFKETERRPGSRKRRTTLDLILSFPRVAGR